VGVLHALQDSHDQQVDLLMRENGGFRQSGIELALGRESLCTFTEAHPIAPPA
jgi:hypothetical protein